MVPIAFFSLLLPVSLSFDTLLIPTDFFQSPSSRVPRNRTLFTLPVSIGTPPQFIPLIVDICKPSSLVFDSECGACTAVTPFNRKKSSSLQSNNTLAKFVDYSLLKVRDVVDVSNTGLCPIKDLDFETVMEDNSKWLFGDGFLGLSPESQLVPRLYSDRSIKKQAFAVFFTGDGSSRVSQSGLQPVISWGSWNLSKYSTSLKPDFDYVSVTSDTQWRIPVKSVKFGDAELASNNSYGILDTHEGGILIPRTSYKKEVSDVLEKFGIYDRNLPCAMFDQDLPDIVVTIGEAEIRIPKEVYVYKNTVNCTHEIARNDTEEVFVFGVAFFQSAYVLFDLYNERVGIAPSRNVKPTEARNYLWIVILAGVGLALLGVATYVYYKKRKDRVEIVYDEASNPLIERINSQLPG